LEKKVPAMVHHETIEKNDLERQASSEDEKPNLPSYGLDEQMRRGSVTSYHEGFFGAFKLESFKRNPNARVVTEATDSEGRPLPDQPPAEPALAMKLKERHLQMIAIGGSIGMSAFPKCTLIGANFC
jgi:amino acid transporter